MFFVHKYLIFDKYLTEIFSLNLWSVFQLSQTASDGFDWNWVKSGPLLFVIFQILNAMDRPIVDTKIWLRRWIQAHKQVGCQQFDWGFRKILKCLTKCCLEEKYWDEMHLWWIVAFVYMRSKAGPYIRNIAWDKKDGISLQVSEMRRNLWKTLRNRDEGFVGDSQEHSIGGTFAPRLLTVRCYSDQSLCLIKYGFSKT